MSTLNNCTLTGNSAYYDSGGAAGGTLNNCILTGNSAQYGGGTAGGTLNNCTLTGNSASWSGGGAAGGTLNNCTLTGNSAATGGGAYSDTLNNCILYYNTAGQGPNYFDSALSYCCTTPDPGSGLGNVTAEPQLASASHLSANSPCRGAGSADYATGVDIDGEPWLNPPSIGCDEYQAGAQTGELSAAIAASWTNVAVGFAVDLTGWISGWAAASAWDFGDGTVLSNRPYATHAWGAPGDYAVVLRAYNETYPAGVSATLTIRVEAPVHYVSAASPNPIPPYASWATAARTIQQAVNATRLPGALVLVTNGVYNTGGRAVWGLMTNRVAVDRPVVVRSVNGPEVTVIQGYQVPGATNGDAAVRCVYLTNGAVLSGFTLADGATRSSGDWEKEGCGGGVWCESQRALVTNCTLTGNSAYYNGGGAYLGTLNHCTLTGNAAACGSGGGAYLGLLNTCTLTGNSAAYGSGGGACNGALDNCTLTGNSAAYSGGGVDGGTLNNCTLAGNSAQTGGGTCSGTLNNCTLTGNSAALSGGGAASCALNNCILYYNTASNDLNYSSSALNYCCTTPDPGSGPGNITAEPQLASAFHLSAGSPCRGAGSPTYATGVDIDGEPWLNPPSIGCDEYRAGAQTGALTVVIAASWTNVAVGFVVDLTGWIGGRVAASAWDFGDGTVLSNRPYASHAWGATGDYTVVLRAYNETYPAGVSATLTIRVVESVHYVSAVSASPEPPYSSWATAARTIQEAVDVAVPGGQVVVTNGLYATGGRAVFGMMTNRVTVDRPVVVKSVNGPGGTLIQGYQVPETTNANGAVRCVYLTSGAVLSGFTLTEGATRGWEGDPTAERSGGGVWCQSTNVLVTNCTLMGNSAYDRGGGAFSGTLENCTLTDNWTFQYGGGASSSTLNNCTLTGNSALYGGGAHESALSDCTLIGNAALYGGGAYAGTLSHCTLTGNSATYGSGGGAAVAR